MIRQSESSLEVQAPLVYYFREGGKIMDFTKGIWKFEDEQLTLKLCTQQLHLQ